MMLTILTILMILSIPTKFKILTILMIPTIQIILTSRKPVKILMLMLTTFKYLE